MNYEELLDRAIGKLPESAHQIGRFDIPKVRGHIQGNRTIISNFVSIATSIRRPPEHLLKYILKELATPGEINKGAALIGRKVSASMINERVKQYVNKFVLCPECKKPDTKIKKEDNFYFIKCLACGEKKPINVKI